MKCHHLNKVNGMNLFDSDSEETVQVNNNDPSSPGNWNTNESITTKTNCI